MPRSSKHAFTFIELLVVIAILTMLAGLLFSVFHRAKKGGLETVSISNLRQDYVALTMYAEDHNVMENLPSREKAWSLVDSRLWHDPTDTWGNTTDPAKYPAMVGSYGYINAKSCTTETGEPTSCAGGYFTTSSPLLVSIFYGSTPIPPGDYRKADVVHGVMMPDRALTLWSDGHIALETPTPPNGNTEPHFTWSSLFLYVGVSKKK